LDIVGRGSRRFLDELGVHDERVRGHGFVEDLEEFYRRGTLFVAPLPEGGGIKIKILEAMARGIPVVTTPVGAEGIVAPRDEAAWIVAPDDRFHEAVLTALDDPEEAVLRASRARRIMEERFSWRGIVDRLTEHYGEG
jgi:glycosyltransferase involved in cell wall biosynthesis